MARKKREDYVGAVHHIFTRGVARTAVAVDDADYERGLFLLERTVSRFALGCHAWCFMPNHSHLIVTSKLKNISTAMQWFGTCTAQAFNQRYERSGHLYQGRFGSRLVESERHLHELARYLPLNPVKAGLCRSPAEWPWSSYRATAGLRTPPHFLEAGGFMGTCDSKEAFVAWVDDGRESTFLDEHGAPRPPEPPSIASILVDDTDKALALAHFRHGYSKSEIARHLGVSRSQIIRRLA